MNAGSATKGALTEMMLGTGAGTAAGRSSKVRIVCMKCGHKWEPGSADEAMTRLFKGGLAEQDRPFYKRNLINSSLDDVFAFMRPFITIGILLLIAVMMMECA